jgi:hypothetical protein
MREAAAAVAATAAAPDGSDTCEYPADAAAVAVLSRTDTISEAQPAAPCEAAPADAAAPAEPPRAASGGPDTISATGPVPPPAAAEFAAPAAPAVRRGVSKTALAVAVLAAFALGFAAALLLAS